MVGLMGHTKDKHPAFVHLHSWSWFSFLRGGSSPSSLVQQAAALGQTSLALTDWMSVAGVVQFQVAARQAGIKAIVGSEVMINGYPLVLLCANQTGYATLNRLLTDAHQRDRENPEVSLEQLADDNDGLFILTGGVESRLRQLVGGGRYEEAMLWLEHLSDLAPKRVFVELVAHRLEGEPRVLNQLVAMARAFDLHTVATNAARYATPEDYLTHDLLNRIRLKLRYDQGYEGQPPNDEAWLKGVDELYPLIPDPTALTNTVALAAECEVNLLPGEITPPGAIIPLGFKHYNAYLRHLCERALLAKYSDSAKRVKAEAILEHKLSIITQIDVGEFFLVVREVMDFARSRGIRCAGRGSAANSIVAYLLDITTVCPIEYRLLFERFLHAGRKGTPDIDVDFDTYRRDEVIEWMQERFSIRHTAMTANVNQYRLRSAVRDVAKFVGWSADIATHELTKVLDSHGDPEDVRQYREALMGKVGDVPLLEPLLTLVEKLQDCPRNLSLHSGGMILARKSLDNFTPIQTSANGVKQATFAKDDIEFLGLVKLDVLGLRAMSAITYALDLIEETTGSRPDLDALSLEDPEVYDLICSGKTLGLFQIESPGQMNLIAKTQPRSFKELGVQVAILRPGPIQGGLIPPYVRRLRGLEPMTPPHPSLQSCLEDTQGLILYQEQVLEIAHAFAGLSMEEADEFRRLMSKARSPERMEAMRARFVSGAMTEELANFVFDKLSKFVGYGFPKSHSFAFARTVFLTAWLKRYHPAAYMAAVIRHWPGMYPMQAFVQEARAFRVTILPPDVTVPRLWQHLELHQCQWAIRQSLTDVAGVSEEDARVMVLEGMARPFDSLEDFYRRVRVDWDVLDKLAQAGALDKLPVLEEQGDLFDAGLSSSTPRKVDRRQTLWQLGILRNRLGPPGGLSLPLLEPPTIDPDEIARLAELTPIERMQWDMRHKGSTAGPHPLALKRFELSRAGVTPINLLAPDYADPAERSKRLTRKGEKVVSVAGLVIARQRPQSAKGIVFITLQDETESIQTIVTPELWAELKPILKSGALILTGVLQVVEMVLRQAEGRVWKGLQVHHAQVLDFDAPVGMAGHPGQIAAKR
jgi:error-prone DNA polymerase